MKGEQPRGGPAAQTSPLFPSLPLALLVFLLIPCAAFPTSAAAQTKPGLPDDSSDLLQFQDGSLLHGKFAGVDLQTGLGWQHPLAEKPIHFLPRNLAHLRFASSTTPAASLRPTCRFRFLNGDEVYGRLQSISSDEVELETWFGTNLRAPRHGLESLTLFPKGFSVLFEGPTGLEGWKLGRSSSWDFRDGAFVTSGVGALGRDFKLPPSMSFEFDLHWNNQFSLIFSLYTDVLDRFDYGSSSYVFYIGLGYISLQRVQAGAGITSMGQVQIPAMNSKNSVRLEFRANKEEATLALLADGALIQRWKDNSGFSGNGSGAVFFSQMAGPEVKLANFRVAEWDGKFERDRAPQRSSSEDLIHLVNRDKVQGKLRSVADDKLTIATPVTQLEIPLARVSQIFVASPETNAAPTPRPWSVRAHLSTGGSLSFDLEKWTGSEVAVKSDNFGSLVFNPQHFRQLEFNLERTDAKSHKTSATPTEFWDVEE